MRFLSRVLTTQRSWEPSAVIARAASSSDTARSSTYAIPNRWDVDKAVLDAYEKVNWVFRCVDAIASAQADLTMLVRRGDRLKGEEVEYPDIKRLLNVRANTYEVAWDFRYRASAIGLLSPRGIFIEKVPSQSGGLAQLHLLAPGQTEPIPHPTEFVSGYRITRADGGVDEVPKENVIWIKLKPHPTDPYKQMTPIIAAGLSIETDFFARLFNRNFIANDGRPGLLIAINGQLNQQDAQEIKRRFSGGFTTAGQTSVIEADGIQVQDLAANPRDLQWEELLKGGKEDILMAFGTPESVLGNASGRTFDNADAERENWYVDTVVRHCNSFSRGLDPLTANTSDLDTVVHDFSEVPVLQRHLQNKIEAESNAYGAGTATLDDYLRVKGMEPLDVPASRVYIHPLGLITAKNPEDAKAVAEGPRIVLTGQMPTGAPGSPQIGSGGPTQASFARAAALPTTEETKEDVVEAELVEEPEVEVLDVPKGLSRNLIERAKLMGKKPEPLAIEAPKEHPYLAERSELEGFIEGSLEAWTTRQETVVLDRLTHVRLRKDTRHWEGMEVKYPRNQKCKDCSEPATKRVIHADGRAYVPCCDAHLADVKARVDEVVRVEEIKELKALDSSYVVETQQWVNDISDALRKRLERVIRKEVRNVVKDMNDNGIETTFDEVMVSDVLDPIAALVERAATNQSERVIRKIRDLDAEGASIKEIQKTIKQMMGTRGQWHKHLAIAATTSAIEGARDRVYSTGGKRVKKKWNAQHDDRTRDTHWKADGQVRSAGSKFRVGKAWLSRPGDPFGPPEETMNCRCHLSWTITN